MPSSSKPNSAARGRLLVELARRIHAVERPHPLRVAVDGVDAAGKTTLADELVAPLQALGRPVVRASIDHFHHPSAVRYRRGRDSPEGYYRDSFDCAGVVARLLEPLGPDGSLRFRRTLFDFRTDAPDEAPLEEAERDAVLVFDGVFLLRSELRRFWDYSIFVAADFSVTVARAELRDRELFRDAGEVRQRYAARYVPGQRLYLDDARPEQRATVVVENDDPSQPVLRDPPAMRARGREA